MGVALGTMDIRLQEAVLGGEAVERVVGLAAGTDKAAQDVVLELAGVAAVGVDLADVQLDGRMVLGSDKPSGGGAERSEHTRTHTNEFTPTRAGAKNVRKDEATQG